MAVQNHSEPGPMNAIPSVLMSFTTASSVLLPYRPTIGEAQAASKAVWSVRQGSGTPNARPGRTEQFEALAEQVKPLDLAVHDLVERDPFHLVLGTIPDAP